ncbi:somatomedin-B and thrombospondin type-1 domain-containing protein-like [Mya arenaria]|uniref:somatomedin-B and thrombospondin type-1 domain-containing protein-like n=1 Tax=Mya arenaria TaxID=6604 RepID=UPI0022E6554E|nr:somatomedin-B and thrombospondin type-1 domain-containing protein-like [Mya arenaria]
MELSKIVLVFGLAVVGTILGQFSEVKVKHFTGCESAGLCCQEKNNTCYVPNSRKMDGTIGNCFCDSKCIQMKDCCSDFQDTCKAKDCILSEWTPWTGCSNTCGRGRMTRKRHVIQHQAFGGKHCPGNTKAKKVCHGDSTCLQQSVEYSREEMQEVGYIMPANFSHYRVSEAYSPQHDIRKNLFFKNFDNIIPRRVAYKAVFKVTHSGVGCQNSPWANVLRVGDQVCVECQPTSMNKRLERCRGHGVYGQNTTWKAIEVRHCHGKWKMISPHDDTSLCKLSDHSFVLV